MRDLCGFTLEKLLDSFKQTNPLPSRIYACFVVFVLVASCGACSYQQQVKCILYGGCGGVCKGPGDPSGNTWHRAVLLLTDGSGLP